MFGCRAMRGAKDPYRTAAPTALAMRPGRARMLHAEGRGKPARAALRLEAPGMASRSPHRAALFAESHGRPRVSARIKGMAFIAFGFFFMKAKRTRVNEKRSCSAASFRYAGISGTMPSPLASLV